MVHKLFPAVFELWAFHDSHGNPICLQTLQTPLITPDPVEVQAGGKELQAQVVPIADEINQLLGTVVTRAPGDIADDSVALVLVQIQGIDLVNKTNFCMSLFLVLEAAFVKNGVIGPLHLVAQVGLPQIVGRRDPGLVAKLLFEYIFF